VDNENGQTVYYLTLNENSTDLNFDLVNIKALSIPSSVKMSVWIEMYPPPDPPLPPLDPCRSGLYIVP
jgi:hypothetical protein